VCVLTSQMPKLYQVPHHSNEEWVKCVPSTFFFSYSIELIGFGFYTDTSWPGCMKFVY